MKGTAWTHRLSHGEMLIHDNDLMMISEISRSSLRAIDTRELRLIL